MNDTKVMLFAHGSRDPLWLDTFRKLTRELSAELGEHRVGLAFMEFAKPTLFAALAEAQFEGTRNIKLLPLFLSAGGHVSRDIPRLVHAARLRFPDMEIELLSPIGEHPSFSSLVGWVARTALNSGAREDLISDSAS
jgi:sirohydrochlorin cobaltochelatase